VSGRSTKYDRSLFQRLEEAGHDVHLLDTQYRMHPEISDFPRRIFYSGLLLDGPNVKHPEYGNPLKRSVFRKFPAFKVSTLSLVSLSLPGTFVIVIDCPFKRYLPLP
jgi:senataxin